MTKLRTSHSGQIPSPASQAGPVKTTGLRTKEGNGFSQCPIGDHILVTWRESSHLYSSLFEKKKKKFKDRIKPVYMLCRINKCNNFFIIA